MLTYQVRIRREKTYLWGGSGIKLNFPSEFLLVVRVDEFGEKITISTEERTNNDVVEFGELNPDETYLLNLKDIAGVFATTLEGKVDSNVICTLLPKTA